MIKRVSLLLVCVLLFISCTITVLADTESSVSRVFDADELLTYEEVSSLQTKLDALSLKYNCDIIVATTPSLEGYDVEEYSDALYKAANYGMGEYKDGFMLLICLEYRDWALTSYGNAGEKFTDAKITYVRENIMPHLSDDEFYEAFDTFADSCEYVLANHGKTTTTFNSLWIVVAIVIGIIIAFITVLIMKSQLKSVRSQPAANNYLKNGSLNITHSRDIFLYSTISRRAKPQQSSASKIGSAGPRQSGKF